MPPFTTPVRRLMPLLAALCLLTSCASGLPPTPAPIRIPPPAPLTMPPPRLPAPASARLADLVANHVEVARQYHLLATQLCGLLIWLQIPPSDLPTCPSSDTP